MPALFKICKYFLNCIIKNDLAVGPSVCACRTIISAGASSIQGRNSNCWVLFSKESHLRDACQQRILPAHHVKIRSNN